MISPDILNRLVPRYLPQQDPKTSMVLIEQEASKPQYWISRWAEHLRTQIFQDSSYFIDAAETSGFIGTGILKLQNTDTTRVYDEFPTVSGYQFGVLLIRASRAYNIESDFLFDAVLDYGRLRVPVIQMIANTNLHAAGRGSPYGYVAAIIDDLGPRRCGITAGHVVDNFNRCRTMPLFCSICGNESKLLARAPGFIDAAKIEFMCSCKNDTSYSVPQLVRRGKEGETVDSHFGSSGKQKTTIMMSLSSPAEIMSAAMPKHFLQDICGHPGDSGSLISSVLEPALSVDLIGMYLGETSCQDTNGNFLTYGYGLDLMQAAGILGANKLIGEFNV